MSLPLRVIFRAGGFGGFLAAHLPFFIGLQVHLSSLRSTSLPMIYFGDVLYMCARYFFRISFVFFNCNVPLQVHEGVYAASFSVVLGSQRLCCGLVDRNYSVSPLQPIL